MKEGNACMNHIAEWLEGLRDRDNKRAYACLLHLLEESEISEQISQYFDLFLELMNEKNSYLRTRGLLLFAANVKWDKNGLVEQNIDCFLAHLEDEKPVVSRKCIQALPQIVQAKPKLRERITAALQNAGQSGYAESMASLIQRDIVEAFEKIGRI